MIRDKETPPEIPQENDVIDLRFPEFPRRDPSQWKEPEDKIKRPQLQRPSLRKTGHPETGKEQGQKKENTSRRNKTDKGKPWRKNPEKP